jgi:membrane fusion protein, copper/silver efflux system
MVLAGRSHRPLTALDPSNNVVLPQAPSMTAESPKTTSPAPAPPRSRRWWMRYLVTPGLVLLSGLLLIFFLGLAQRLGWITAGEGSASATTADAAGQIYTCPMHPQIRQPGPGRCPICSMALVPATTETGADLDELAVRIEPAQRRLANIRTTPAERVPLSVPIRSVGVVAIDESRLATISSYISGRIERLFADYTGVDVQKGDHLAVVYSPELYAKQVEYLESKRAAAQTGTGTLEVVRQTQQRLAANARQRLVELGMTEEQLAELDRSGSAVSRLTIYAPTGGTVIEKLAVEGKYISVGEPIYRIADLSSVWLMLQLFPEDAARVRFGQRVEARVQSLPGQAFEGRVAFIHPTVDEKTRTVDVRVEMENPGRRLRPGDYASVQIEVPLSAEGEVYDADLAGKWISPMHPQIIRDEPGECPICGMDLVPTSKLGYSDEPIPQPTAIVVPRSAVLMTGSTSLVYVETEPGRFEIRPVKIGQILAESVSILEGVAEGEQVAVSGNFLIDSQMQLSGRPSLIDPTRAVAAGPEAKGPLSLSELSPVQLTGPAGESVEALLDAYATVQQALADDRPPTGEDIQTLQDAAKAVGDFEDISPSVREEVAASVEAAAHLHHMELEQARESFKSLSRAVLHLAAQYRGENAEPVIHFYCAMVKGDGGDWLQQSRPPANPYWGEAMLRCVQHEAELPLPETSPPDE